VTSDRSTAEALLAEFIERSMAGDRDVTAESLAPDDPKLAAELAERIRVYRQVEDLLGGASRVAEGERVGRYRIEGRLGHGGMGEVFRAHDTELDRPVALKFLTVARGGDEAVRRRLLREARAAAALDHPNLCPVYEVGDAGDGRLFRAMALVDGESLAARLERGPLEPAEILDVTRQVAAGLAEAHRGGVVHRDVKPANLMIGTGGVVKLLDFGLAQRDGQDGRSLEGLRPGTLAYMAPEQLRGEPIDARSDVWALGAVMVEMATGRSPFGGPTPEATLYSIAHRSPAGLEALPATLRPVARRALQRRPDDRYADAGELLVALPQEVEARRRDSAVRRLAHGVKGHWWLVAAAASVAAALAFLLHDGSGSPWPRADDTVSWSASGSRPAAEPGWAIENRPSRRASTGEGPSIGVVPFVNLGAPDRSHFASALSDLVRTDLAKLGGVARVKPAAIDPAADDVTRSDLVRRLGVGFLVDGTVAVDGDRARVSARLVDADDGIVIWTETYDLGLTELFDVRGRIARAVSDQIDVRRSAAEEARLAPPPAVSAQASDAYFRGLYLVGRAQTKGPDYFELLRAAEAQFERATELEPEWAEAWGELAMVERQLGNQLDDVVERRVAQEKTGEYAGRALALNPDVASARRALAAVRFWDGDLEGSEREHVEALRLEPNTDPGLFGTVLGSAGKYEEAVQWLRHARELNPLDGRIGYLIGYYAICGEDLETAEAQVRELHEVYRNEEQAALLSAAIAERRGEYEREVAILQSHREVLMPNYGTSLHRRLAYALAKSGRREESLEVVAAARARWGAEPDPNVLVALGDVEGARRRVEFYYRERGYAAVGADCWPEIDTLMEMPEIARMLRELNRPGTL